MPRRVVTGTNAAGRSIVVADEELPPTAHSASPANAYYPIWGADGRCRVPSDGSLPSVTTWFPPASGFRYLVAVFPPDSTARSTEAGDVDLDAQRREMEEKFPGAAAVTEPGGMHTTQTVDVGLVLNGEIWLELDDGADVRLTRGDLVVQNGTRHAWRNRSAAECTMAFVLIGADPAAE